MRAPLPGSNPRRAAQPTRVRPVSVAAVLPLILSKLRVDPAVVSAPFITYPVEYYYAGAARLAYQLVMPSR